ncbi:MAG: LytR C-terminal domain-containing protein [Actinomycetota bacterium]
MGRHSSHSQFRFYRSVVGWALPWLLVASVVATGVWFGVDAIGGDGVQRRPRIEAAADTPTPDTSPRSEKSARPSPTPSRPDRDAPEPDEDEGSPFSGKLITEGITVQVLNGSTSPEAAASMSDQLSGLGFEIVAVNESSKGYPLTTVFWSSEASRGAAEALAGRYGWAAEPKPDNLTDEVSLHVVVGDDF